MVPPNVLAKHIIPAPTARSECPKWVISGLFRPRKIRSAYPNSGPSLRSANATDSRQYETLGRFADYAENTARKKLCRDRAF